MITAVRANKKKDMASRCFSNFFIKPLFSSPFSSPSSLLRTNFPCLGFGQ